MLNRIGLLDAMGYGNLGDAATQDAVIAGIRERLPGACIVAFSFVPADTSKRHGIPCFPITRDSDPISVTSGSRVENKMVGAAKAAIRKLPILHKFTRRLADIARESLFLARAYRAVRGLDVLVFSGGGQICELWGGAYGHPFNLFKFAVLARLARKRLYFLNVGAEPLQSALSRFFVKSAVRIAHYISFRDAYSKAVVRSLGITREVVVSHDCAYGLDVSNCLNKTLSQSACPVVGLNPIGFCDPRIWPRKEERVYRLYLEKLCKFGAWLLDEGYYIRLFTTSPRADGFAIADLKEQLVSTRSPQNPIGAAESERAGLSVREVIMNTVEEALSEISKWNYVVTSRYHGIVFSHLLRKPVIALGYQNKSDAAMEPLGLGDLSATIESFETEWLIQAFRRLVSRRESVKSREESAVTGYAAALNRQFDGLFSESHQNVTTPPSVVMVPR